MNVDIFLDFFECSKRCKLIEKKLGTNFKHLK